MPPHFSFCFLDRQRPVLYFLNEKKIKNGGLIVSAAWYTRRFALLLGVEAEKSAPGYPGADAIMLAGDQATSVRPLAILLIRVAMAPQVFHAV